MTKRKDILKRIASYAKSHGLELTVTEGGSHTKVQLGDRRTTIPRHNEINELTTKAIYKQIGVDK